MVFAILLYFRVFQHPNLRKLIPAKIRYRGNLPKLITAKIFQKTLHEFAKIYPLTPTFVLRFLTKVRRANGGAELSLMGRRGIFLLMKYQ